MRYKPKILVVGSFVKDLIISSHRFPDQGETVLGTDFKPLRAAREPIRRFRLPGSVQASPWWGKVGDDAFGKDLVESCVQNGIDCSRVMVDRLQPSSVGNVQLQVDENGKTQNRIIVVPGANMTITTEEISFCREEIGRYDMVLLQLEIPMQVNEAVVRYAHEQGVPVMLNSAPADTVSREMLAKLDYISRMNMKRQNSQELRFEEMEKTYI